MGGVHLEVKRPFHERQMRSVPQGHLTIAPSGHQKSPSAPSLVNLMYT
jgi:hypothetical protein